MDPAQHPNCSSLHDAGRRLVGKIVDGVDRNLKDQLDTPTYSSPPPTCASLHYREGQVQEGSQKELRTTEARIKCLHST